MSLQRTLLAALGLTFVGVCCSIERPMGRFVSTDGAMASEGRDANGGRNGHIGSIAPGQPLIGDAECQALVQRNDWEPRPGNTVFNQRRPTAAELAQLSPWDQALGFDNRAVELGKRVSGQFTGTTDEILQWAACKWGFDEDLVRAEAAELGEWRQDSVGTWTSDLAKCPPDAPTRSGRDATECPETYGIYQLMWHWYPDSWPMARDDTAFHVDFTLGLRRVCFEGWATYLADNAPDDAPYVAGDAWGCGGADFSGNWYDPAAKTYIAAIKQKVNDRPWTLPVF